MKKQASTRFLMYVMISLHIYLINAAVSLSESNDSTSVCNGSVEDCLSVHHLDSQLPTVSSSHFRRILAEGDGQRTAGTADPNNPFYKCTPGDRYTSCLTAADGIRINCNYYNKGC
ncbi:uncharacterized protein LOC124824033 [Vigna umbellata]|uniref:uncharacterized protein LOC124824033 n=1 Tax=Vigna umbellata TaxID=87088 RepID=UPI001F5F4228|nr:uncharacterized protein LOC124824033 [Vigna umbellata]